jgi:hypothetical protein
MTSPVIFSIFLTLIPTMPTPRTKRNETKKAKAAAEAELVDEEDDADVVTVDETQAPLEDYPAASDSNEAAAASSATAAEDAPVATFEEQMEAARATMRVFDDERDLKASMYTKRVDEIAEKVAKMRGVRRLFEASCRCVYNSLIRDDPGFDSMLSDVFVCAKNTLREMENSERRLHLEAQYYTALAAIDEDGRFEAFPGAALTAVRSAGPKAFAEDVEAIWDQGKKVMENAVDDYVPRESKLNLGFTREQLLAQMLHFHTRVFLDHEATYEQAFGACSLSGEACHKLPAKK